MPVIYLKKPRDVRYTNATGASIVFSPVSSVEAKGRRAGLINTCWESKDAGADMGQVYFSIGMVPVKIAAEHLLRLEGFKADESESVEPIDCESIDLENRVRILTQLIDMEGFEDLLEFIKTLADGQKKTS